MSKRIHITVEKDAVYAALGALDRELRECESSLERCQTLEGRAYWSDSIATKRTHLHQLDEALRNARPA